MTSRVAALWTILLVPLSCLLLAMPRRLTRPPTCLVLLNETSSVPVTVLAMLLVLDGMMCTQVGRLPLSMTMLALPLSTPIIVLARRRPALVNSSVSVNGFVLTDATINFVLLVACVAPLSLPCNAVMSTLRNRPFRLSLTVPNGMKLSLDLLTGSGTTFPVRKGKADPRLPSDTQGKLVL